jgi:hypothetical protein
LKTCKRCGEAKARAEFIRDSRTADKLLASYLEVADTGYNTNDPNQLHRNMSKEEIEILIKTLPKDQINQMINKLSLEN